MDDARSIRVLITLTSFY